MGRGSLDAPDETPRPAPEPRRTPPPDEAPPQPTLPRAPATQTPPPAADDAERLGAAILRVLDSL